MNLPDWTQDLAFILGHWVTDLAYAVQTYIGGVGGLLVVVGVGLAVVIGLNLVWAVMRACVLEPSRDAVRLIAARLAEAVRSGTAPGPALAGLRSLLPWPHPGRVGAAVRELEGAAPPTLVGALVANRLLPSALAPLAVGAERLGPVVLAAWLRALADESPLRRSFFRRLAPPLLTILGLIGVTLFMGVFIAPKFTYIARELGTRGPPMERLSALVDHGWTIAVLAAVPIAVGIACWARWRWIPQQRLMRGETIVQAVQAGVPEDDIAAALSLPRTGGSLAALCRAAGWAVRDADELAVAVAAARRRRERIAALAMSAFEIAAPLALAIPVCLIGKAVFGTLLTIISAFGEVL